MEFDCADLSGDSREATESMLKMDLEGADGHSEIMLELFDQILARFERLDAQLPSKSSNGWSTHCEMTLNDHEAYLRTMRRFSGNYQLHNGRLLTPLVKSMRVRGPFYTELGDVRPKLVLIDGHRLGHTPESGASVSTNISSALRAGRLHPVGR